MEGVFGGFFLLFLLGIAATGFCIWGVVDAASQPDSAWERASQNKMLWVALQVVGIFVCIGFVFTIVYFASIRPQVVASR